MEENNYMILSFGAKDIQNKMKGELIKTLLQANSLI